MPLLLELQNSFPVYDLYGHTAILNNNTIYVIGGWYKSQIYFSEIDSKGNLSAWNIISELPFQLYASEAAIINNHIATHFISSYNPAIR